MGSAEKASHPKGNRKAWRRQGHKEGMGDSFGKERKNRIRPSPTEQLREKKKHRCRRLAWKEGESSRRRKRENKVSCCHLEMGGQGR